MADITMCDDKTCMARKSCHRFTATINPYRQSYFVNKPTKNEHGSCEYFIRIEMPAATFEQGIVRGMK